MTVWPSNNTMPSIYSWYAGVQRALPGNFTLDVSYSGNRSVHLMDQRQLNALPAGTTFGSANALTMRPVSWLGQLECGRNKRLLALQRVADALEPPFCPRFNG